MTMTAPKPNSRQFQFSLRALLLFMVVASVGLSWFWKVIEKITPPMIYMVHAEFLELPPTDEALKEWLLQQPGVYQGLIVREGNSLTLNWFHITKRFADPISPTVRDEFERFGYKGLVNYSENKGRVDK